MLVIIILQAVTLRVNRKLGQRVTATPVNNTPEMPSLLSLMLRPATPVGDMCKPTDSKLLSAFMSDQF